MADNNCCGGEHAKEQAALPAAQQVELTTSEPLTASSSDSGASDSSAGGGGSPCSFTWFPNIRVDGGKLQMWEDDGTDPDGNPINPRFKRGSTATVSITECGNSASQEYEVYLTTDPTTGKVMINLEGAPLTFQTCHAPFETFTTQGSLHTFPYRSRYRREYHDYTADENQSSKIIAVSDMGRTAELNVNLAAFPTCRAADSSFCGCFNEEQYNVIDVETLAWFPTQPFGCGNGNPIDIDVACATPAQDDDTPITGGVTMYYTPFPNTIPVIDNVAYNTLDLPAPPPGKINVIKILTTTTRNQLRRWVCEHLRFATVTARGFTCECYKITADYAGATLSLNYEYGDSTFTATGLGDIAPCIGGGESLRYGIVITGLGTDIVCPPRDSISTQQPISGSIAVVLYNPVSGSSYYIHYFDINGAPIGGWNSSTVHPDPDCLNIAPPTPTVVIEPCSLFSNSPSPQNAVCCGSSCYPVDCTNPELATLVFDWPFNDLYFSANCPNGESVNLVPC